MGSALEWDLNHSRPWHMLYVNRKCGTAVDRGILSAFRIERKTRPLDAEMGCESEFKLIDSGGVIHVRKPVACLARDFEPRKTGRSASGGAVGGALPAALSEAVAVDGSFGSTRMSSVCRICVRSFFSSRAALGDLDARRGSSARGRGRQRGELCGTGPYSPGSGWRVYPAAASVVEGGDDGACPRWGVRWCERCGHRIPSAMQRHHRVGGHTALLFPGSRNRPGGTSCEDFGRLGPFSLSQYGANRA